ncbi:MAG: Fe-S cluster assembly protein SufD [Pseudomonadota bacterium]
MLNRDAYLSAFERFGTELPAPERAQRSAALQRFFESGLPSADIEEWKYTDFSRLAGEAVTLAAPAAAPDLSDWRIADAQARIWLNGRSTHPCARPAPPAGEAGDSAHPGLAALNAAFALPGLDLALAAGENLERPLQALFVTRPQTDGAMTHLHHRIRLGENARATVLLHDLGLGDARRWVTQTLDIELAANAALRLIRVQDESPGTRGWFQGTARLHAGAQFDAVQIDFGGGFVRNDWRIRLLAPGAGTSLHGLFAPTGRTHVDNHTVIDHLAPRCTSRESFRGLAWERARAVFNGRIVVHPGAQKTDSEQRLANLLLSKQAEINAKPELEIHADDVKCAHGATFGRLDPGALFYLRTRGVPEEAARALLTYSFADEILRHIEWPALRKQVTARFLARMGGGIDAGELV